MQFWVVLCDCWSECIVCRVKDTQPGDNREVTVFTEKDGSGCVNYRQGRPALLVSSTSWTGRLVLTGKFQAYVWILRKWRWLNELICDVRVIMLSNYNVVMCANYWCVISSAVHLIISHAQLVEIWRVRMLYHHHHHCLTCTISEIAANNLQSGLSSASLVASSTLRLWNDRLFFTVVSEEVWGRLAGLF